MAKKKTTRGKAATPEPAGGRQKNIFVLRGTDEFKAWLDGYAASKGVPITVAIDLALRAAAKQDRHPPPPPRTPPKAGPGRKPKGD